LGRGIVNEIYSPWVDHAAIRDCGLIVTGPDHLFSDEQRDCTSNIQTAAPGIPAYFLQNDCSQGRFRISKEVIADPDRDVLLQRIRLTPLIGSLDDFRLFVVLSPRLGDQGKDNSGWLGAYRDWQMLFAHYQDHSLALGSSAPWKARSVGFVGASDAWQDIHQHGRMTRQYDRADHGHIALAGEIDLNACDGQFVLALGINRSCEAAGLNVAMSLTNPFDDARDQYIQEWRDWQKGLARLDAGEYSALVTANAEQRNRADRSRPHVTESSDADDANLFRTSMMVLRVHRSKHFLGAGVASLSVPWGEVRDDDDLGGYHLVWPRDLVEEAFGLLAGGAHDEVQSVLNYLRATQKTEGGWPQDMWLNGSAFSEGVQLDEAALPILLVDLAARESAVKKSQIESFWPMVRAAAAFIIRSGPATGEDRWENTPGLSPYTLATEIAAMLVAARMADQFGPSPLAEYFRQTADLWNDLIEPWTYITDTPLAKRIGVDGYYVRIAPSPGMRTVMRQHPDAVMKQAHDLPVTEVVSPDALALVRFGIRAPDDPRILNTIKVIDSLTRSETPPGSSWHRYNGDYYGESDDGQPHGGRSDKSGHGRLWPLLTGERGHFELASGNVREARRLLVAMNGFASQVGFLPEQVWDRDDIPGRDLYRGRPSGSAMPLAWTHSEYIRLLRSIRDRRVFDRPLDAWQRYVKRQMRSDLALWRFDHQPASFPAGRRVRVETMSPAVVHFSDDNWRTVRDAETCDTGFGIHVVDLPTAAMPVGESLKFTFRWPASANRWEGRDFQMSVDNAIAPVPRVPEQKRRPRQSRAFAEMERHG
jgi:glucoamylase